LRLDAGAAEHSIVWYGHHILLQFKVEVFVVSILLEENANIGILDEIIPVIGDVLKPFCVNFSHYNAN
jgi:hypothetical protein